MVDRYAARTAVPASRTRTDIETLQGRAGATAFGYLSQGDDEIIVFEIANRRVLMRLPLPSPDAREFTHSDTGRRRTIPQAQAVYQQAVRAAWRSLLLIIKAKLIAIADGVTTIEREFLADIALPDGRTIGQFLAPQLDQVYRSGEMPALLPGRGDE